MTEIVKGCVVKVVTLANSVDNYGWDDDYKMPNQTFIVKQVFSDGDVEDENCTVYSIYDLEYLHSGVEVNINKIEIGDEVVNSQGTIFSVQMVEFNCEGDEEDLFVSTETGNEYWMYSGNLYHYIKPKEVVELEIEEDNDEAPVFIITEDSVTLTYKGRTDTITDSNANFVEVRQCIIDSDFDSAQGLMNVSAGIENWGNGLLQIDNGTVIYNQTTITNKLVDRIVTMMSTGQEEFEKFAKCLGLIMEQESFKTRERIMDFVACGKLDINEDGHIVAFKNVRSDYYDKHSGRFRNQVGDSPSMPRSEVDDDHDHQCSHGLHVCSPTYLKGFWGTSGRTMRVTVDPRDFVAIPYDYQDSKARVCKYTVVEDVSDKVGDYL